MNNSIDFSDTIQSLQEMMKSLVERTPYIAVAVLVFFIFFFLAKFVRRLTTGVSDRYRNHRNLGLVLGRLAQGAIILVGTLVALVVAVPGFTPGQLFNLLGIGSVAVGFAFRDVLQNFLAGILLLLSEPFRIGDQIRVGNYEGTVEDIQTRATFIRTFDSKRVVIPNANLFTNSVTVTTAFESRRLQYDVSVSYKADITRVKSLVLEALEQIEDVMKDPAPEAYIVELGESAVVVRLRWWISPGRRRDEVIIRDLVLDKVKKALMEADVEFPVLPVTIERTSTAARAS